MIFFILSLIHSFYNLFILYCYLQWPESIPVFQNLKNSILDLGCPFIAPSFLSCYLCHKDTHTNTHTVRHISNFYIQTKITCRHGENMKTPHLGDPFLSHPCYKRKTLMKMALFWYLLDFSSDS